MRRLLEMSPLALGDRLTVGRQTLDLAIKVRILVPELVAYTTLRAAHPSETRVPHLLIVTPAGAGHRKDDMEMRTNEKKTTGRLRTALLAVPLLVGGATA